MLLEVQMSISKWHQITNKPTKIRNTNQIQLFNSSFLRFWSFWSFCIQILRLLVNLVKYRKLKKQINKSNNKLIQIQMIKLYVSKSGSSKLPQSHTMSSKIAYLRMESNQRKYSKRLKLANPWTSCSSWRSIMRKASKVRELRLLYLIVVLLKSISISTTRRRKKSNHRRI